MSAKDIVYRLLEDHPDEVDPKMEMLRNDPASEMDKLVDALWRNGIKTMSYVRKPPLASFCIRLHHPAPVDKVGDWFHNFLETENVVVDRSAIQVVNLGWHYRNEGFRVDFPMPGPPVPYRDYRIGI